MVTEQRWHFQTPCTNISNEATSIITGNQAHHPNKTSFCWPLHTMVSYTTECPIQHLLSMAVQIPSENEIHAQLQTVYTRGEGWLRFALIINQEQTNATTKSSFEQLRTRQSNNKVLLA